MCAVDSVDSVNSVNSQATDKSDFIRIQFRVSNSAKFQTDDLRKSSSIPEAAYLVMTKINSVFAGFTGKVKTRLDLKIPYPSTSLLEASVNLLIKRIANGELENKHITEGREIIAYIDALKLITLSDLGISTSSSILVEIS